MPMPERMEVKALCVCSSGIAVLQQSVLLQRVLEEFAVKPRVVRGVAGVLPALEPVAGQDRAGDLADGVGPYEYGPGRQQGAQAPARGRPR